MIDVIFQWIDMWLRILSKLPLVLLCFSTFEIFAIVPNEVDKLLQLGQFQEVIDILKIDNTELSEGKRHYFLGVAYSHLKQYELAATNFQEAVKEVDTGIDINYLYGIALYNINEINNARKEFTISAKKNTNYIMSTYYIAHTSELLNDLSIAKINYKKLIKDKRTDIKLLQVSYFQYAKILFKIMRREKQYFSPSDKRFNRLEENLANYVLKYVLPLLKKAHEIDPYSEIHEEINQLIKDLIEEFKLDPDLLVNGRRVSSNQLLASIKLGVKYNDNIIGNKKGSAVYDTELFAKYNIIHKKKYIISPEVKFLYTKSTNQRDPEIFQADSSTFITALRNSLEYTLNGMPASSLLELEYEKYYSDWKKNHNREYLSSSYSIGLVEQVSFSNSGETYFKFKYTDHKEVGGEFNYKYISASIDQYWALNEGQHLLIGSLSLGQLNFVKIPISSSSSYTARLVYIIFEIINTYTLQLGFSTTVTDPKMQRPERGYETILNPSIEIIKAITDKLRLGISYNYVEGHSKSDSYRYRKNIVGADLSYSF